MSLLIYLFLIINFVSSSLFTTVLNSFCNIYKGLKICNLHVNQLFDLISLAFIQSTDLSNMVFKTKK